MAQRSFKGKNIVISGGSKGIGREISKKLAKEGANLFILARNPKDLKQIVTEIQADFPDIRCSGLSVDVGEYTQVKKAAKEIIKLLQNIDGIISNAGLAIPQYFIKAEIEDFEKINKIKYLGAVYLVKELYPFLNHGSFISFTASVVGYLGVFGYSSYVGPNFALIGLAETLVQEFVEKNIQVSVLCPPDTDTPGYEEEEKTKPIETKMLSGKVKLMKAEEVAEKFLRKLKKGKFIITVNFDSSLFYILKMIMPQMMTKIMAMMVRGIQKKMNKK